MEEFHIIYIFSTEWIMERKNGWRQHIKRQIQSQSKHNSNHNDVVWRMT